MSRNLEYIETYRTRSPVNEKNKALSNKLLDFREILRINEVNNSNWD